MTHQTTHNGVDAVTTIFLSRTYLKVYFMHVLEKQEEEPTVVHLLAELGQGDVALLLAVGAEQEGGDGHQVLADVLLGLLLTRAVNFGVSMALLQSVAVSKNV